MATLNRQVGADADDGYVTPTYFESGSDYIRIGNGDGAYDAFLRFTNITIPSGATITNATLTLLAEVNAGTMTVRTNVRGQKALNPAAPTTKADIDGRTRTSAFVAWDFTTFWYSNTWYGPGNLAAIIQEIIDQPGWSSGNAVIIFVDDDGSNDPAYRYAWSHNDSPANSAKLEITYTVPPTCYALTRAHTGSGSNPTAAPTYSDGCALGKYHSGEVITMTAHPAAGYYLSSWTGTDGAQSKTLTMPAGTRTVTANYTEIPADCYALTRAHTGSGSDPTALPANSDGCAAGQYTAGEVIAMTALPAAGSELDSWTGTDGAQSNTLTMPASARTVTAKYATIPVPRGSPIFF